MEGAWTVFEELSGGLADRPGDDWVRLADGGDLIHAGYNDAIAWAEFVQVDRGQLVRHFMQDEDDPSAAVDIGRLPEEAGAPWTRWTDVARWVDEKDGDFTARARGLLWIHQVA